MNAAPKNETAQSETVQSGAQQDAQQDAQPPESTQAAVLGDLPSASGTSIHERGTLTGRWEILSRRWVRFPVIMMLASLLLGLGIVQLTFQIGNSVYRSVTWKHETQTTLKQVSELQRDVKILQDAERMASDPVYLEQLARCQGFVGSNEHIIVAKNAPSNPGYSCSPVRLP